MQIEALCAWYADDTPHTPPTQARLICHIHMAKY